MNLSLYIYDLIAFGVGFLSGVLVCVAAFASIAGDAVEKTGDR